MTPNIQAYRPDGGDIGTGRIKEIADNVYGDEEKGWLAKRLLTLLDELEVKDKLIAEMQARDIDIKQHAQALFEAIANPSDHYVPAYARCLREALNGTSTGKGE